jgi:hypothetical protein
VSGESCGSFRRGSILWARAEFTTLPLRSILNSTLVLLPSALHLVLANERRLSIEKYLLGTLK